MLRVTLMGGDIARQHPDADERPDYRKLVDGEIDKWGKVIKFTGIKLS